MTPPRFFGAPGEDTFEFLTSCEDRLCDLVLVETRGVDYTKF